MKSIKGYEIKTPKRIIALNVVVVVFYIILVLGTL
jgi:hypothetical protein